MPAIQFEILATCRETGARAGLLTTPHAVIETPVFMPVGTQATVKGLPHRDLLSPLDARIILANTYHLFLRPGHEIIQRLGGLHRFMSWPRALLTDSGGFQVFSLSDLRKVTDEGVTFRSHLDGDLHFFTPESTVDIQLALGSDIMMVLDECLSYPATHAAACKSVDRTVRWAQAAFNHYRREIEEAEQSGQPYGALFPIVQGSTFESTRLQCAARLLELNAEGYAIGGLSVGEPRPTSLEMTALTALMLPPLRPRYVMGVGLPEELPEYVAQGIDMMDCVLPSRNARNGCLFTSKGKVIIKQARYRDDPAPADETCGCYTCQNFSRAYLRHLFTAGEMLFCTLATMHNLHHYFGVMRGVRTAILEGRFPAYLREVRNNSAATAPE